MFRQLLPGPLWALRAGSPAGHTWVTAVGLGRAAVAVPGPGGPRGRWAMFAEEEWNDGAEGRARAQARAGPHGAPEGLGRPVRGARRGASEGRCLGAGEVTGPPPPTGPRGSGGEAAPAAAGGLRGRGRLGWRASAEAARGAEAGGRAPGCGGEGAPGGLRGAPGGAGTAAEQTAPG